MKRNRDLIEQKEKELEMHEKMLLEKEKQKEAEEKDDDEKDSEENGEENVEDDIEYNVYYDQPHIIQTYRDQNRDGFVDIIKQRKKILKEQEGMTAIR